MGGQLVLCSHRYQFVDVIQILKYIFLNKQFLISNNVAFVTSSQNVNIASCQLVGKHVYGLNISIIVSKRENLSAANQIQSHLANGGTIFVFYEQHRVSAGIWHILNNLQHDVDISIAHILIPNAPITTWVPHNVVANLINDMNVLFYDIINNGECVRIEQLPSCVFANMDAEEFKDTLRRLLYDAR